MVRQQHQPADEPVLPNKTAAVYVPLLPCTQGQFKSGSIWTTIFERLLLSELTGDGQNGFCTHSVLFFQIRNTLACLNFANDFFSDFFAHSTTLKLTPFWLYYLRLLSYFMGYRSIDLVTIENYFLYDSGDSCLYDRLAAW